MADLVASLIGIIGAGTKVAMVLSQVASEIGSAGKEAQIMAREIRSFCTIIRVLSQTMDSVHSDMSWRNYCHCSETISDMTAVSKEMFTEILGLIDGIQKVSWGGSVSLSNPKFNFASRIKWVLNKPKFAFLRSALEVYKSNLGLLIGSIQLSQSLGPQPSLSSPGSGEDILQRSGPNRASMALSVDLQDIANDFQASIQEMEAVRLDAENEEPNEPPPWASLPENEGQIDATTMGARQDPQLQNLIATAHDEVRSLRPASSVYSDSTASIYSSLSRHSQRLSLIVDELPMLETLNVSERRKSNAWSMSATRMVAPSNLVPISEAQPQIAPEQRWSWAKPEPKSIVAKRSHTPTVSTRPSSTPQTEDAEKVYLELLHKYKNVKRLYFDGIHQIEQLEAKVSAVQTPAPTA